MSKYKPLLVFYMKEMDSPTMENVDSNLKRVKEETGFNIIVIRTEGEQKVELLSIDKATVVEDIHKYLEEKILNRNNEK